MTEIKRNTNNEKLIKAVNFLRLEFPIVEIANKMQLDKGNVSAYLNNKKSVSSNFIRKFEDAFNIDTSNFDGNKEIKNPSPEGKGSKVEEDNVRLVNENEFLKQTVKDLLEVLKSKL